jgi:heme exporter protein C
LTGLIGLWPSAPRLALARLRECAKYTGVHADSDEKGGAMLTRLANPARFMRVSGAVLPWLGAATALVLAVGLVWSLVLAPPDYQQGETVRIMFIHVPSAWMALSVYLFVAVSSAVALVWRHPLAEIAGHAAAPVGAAFTLVCLATGSLWGRPMWGAWWVWDARLTSVLVLFFLYLGYIALVNAFDDCTRGARAGALLALVGVVNLPIIKFSVDWWNTLHQPASVVRIGGPAIAMSMLLPLLAMAVGFMLLFFWLLLLRMRTALNQRKIEALRLHTPATAAEFATEAALPAARPALR